MMCAVVTISRNFSGMDMGGSAGANSSAEGRKEAIEHDAVEREDI